LRQHLTLVRMAVIKKTTNAGKDEDKIEYKLVQTLWKSA
jgi:hypothetical protein